MLRPIGICVFVFAGVLVGTLPVCAAPRVISGDFEHGEKYTEVYVSPEETDDARDDEDFERYSFRKSWLQYDQDLGKKARITMRAQELRRRYASRPDLDNNTHHYKLRVNFQPAPRWAIWPDVSLQRRDYKTRNLDNDILRTTLTARYRWGVRHNVRFGGAFTNASYDQDIARDRENYRLFVEYERPVREGTTIRVGGKVEETNFRFPSASRENAAKGSAHVGFRHEF